MLRYVVRDIINQYFNPMYLWLLSLSKYGSSVSCLLSPLNVRDPKGNESRVTIRNSKAGQVAGGFTVELEKAYAAYSNQPVTPKNALFHAHGIFCPVIDSVEKGIEKKALVAATVDYGHPTAENLTEYLIASNSAESALISQTFEDYKDFAKEQLKPDSKLDVQEVPSSYDFNDEYDLDEAPY